MWPDPKESECIESDGFARAEDSSFTRRFAAAGYWFIRGGERRCVAQNVSVTGFGALGRVFVCAARDRSLHVRANWFGRLVSFELAAQGLASVTFRRK
jgi:hypothetical protein